MILSRYRGYGEDWAPPAWENPQTYEPITPASVAPVPVDDGSAYYTHGQVYPTVSGGEEEGVTIRTAPAAGGESGSSFFTSLVQGFMKGAATPTTAQRLPPGYYQQPQGGLPSWALPAGAAVLGAGFLLMMLSPSKKASPPTTLSGHRRKRRSRR